MDPTIHKTSKIPVAEDNDAGGSAPITDTSPPPSQASVKTKVKFGSPEHLERLKKTAAEGAIRKKWILDAMPPKGVFSSVDEFCSNPVIAMLRRDGRKSSAETFRRGYVHGTSTDGCSNPLVGTKEQRSCIWSKDSRFWMEKSSGIIWVGVHGMDSVCVVTRREDLDWKRVCSSFLKGLSVLSVLSQFRISIISDIEDLADPSSEVRKWISCSIEKPFGVVCVLPKIRLGSGDEAPSFGYDDKKAVKFLREKMTNETSFTVIETIQTAISAFQRLFEKKLEANEIGVSVMDPKYVVHADEVNKDPSVQELEICEIEKYLAAIYEPGPGVIGEHSGVIDEPAINEPGPGEIGEHSGVIDEPSPPSKRKRTSLVLEAQVPAPGGSTFTFETMEY